ncbi:expressed unknown protein [Seminavis robusta]|uniref:Methyltransferase type 11 domain-containing protein n=1 Tax=Seminavis robusta TaxID=568900 RepID=A0A9N8DRV0_9STRA|nr:expressed unknown protein [Seminavis robusta]|eukprot:Sro324_g117670.1 n/a (414) ;mRNA; f:70027-71473
MTAIGSRNNVREARTLRTVYSSLIETRVIFVLLMACLVFISYFESNSEEVQLLRSTSWRSLIERVDVGALPKWGEEEEEIVERADAAPRGLRRSPLDIPEGEAVALPSIRTEVQVDRKHYGGHGDKQHLGGFTTYDKDGVSPWTWKYMVETLGVKSIMDVGCGKGVSSLWFVHHGLKTLCLEGSHDAVENTLLPHPEKHIVEHDFSRGPYWPADTYDAVWSVEFAEHVGRNFHHNYIQAFRKAALIFVTHSQWGGWHHVEVHDDDWWINKFESFGFRYSPSLTKQIRKVASEERDHCKDKNNEDDPACVGPDGKLYSATHIWLHMQVFINPMVASLPEHAHLFAEKGCFEKRENGKFVNRDCGQSSNGAATAESVLPESFLPLKLTPKQDKKWFRAIQEHIEEETTGSTSSDS